MDFGRLFLTVLGVLQVLMSAYMRLLLSTEPVHRKIMDMLQGGKFREGIEMMMIAMRPLDFAQFEYWARARGVIADAQRLPDYFCSRRSLRVLTDSVWEHYGHYLLSAAKTVARSAMFFSGSTTARTSQMLVNAFAFACSFLREVRQAELSGMPLAISRTLVPRLFQWSLSFKLECKGNAMALAQGVLLAAACPQILNSVTNATRCWSHLKSFFDNMMKRKAAPIAERWPLEIGALADSIQTHLETRARTLFGVAYPSLRDLASHHAVRLTSQHLWRTSRRTHEQMAPCAAASQDRCIQRAKTRPWVGPFSVCQDEVVSMIFSAAEKSSMSRRIVDAVLMVVAENVTQWRFSHVLRYSHGSAVIGIAGRMMELWHPSQRALQKAPHAASVALLRFQRTGIPASWSKMLKTWRPRAMYSFLKSSRLLLRSLGNAKLALYDAANPASFTFRLCCVRLSKAHRIAINSDILVLIMSMMDGPVNASYLPTKWCASCFHEHALENMLCAACLAAKPHLSNRKRKRARNGVCN